MILHQNEAAGRARKQRAGAGGEGGEGGELAALANLPRMDGRRSTVLRSHETQVRYVSRS
jgi:hypothetical protein